MAAGVVRDLKQPRLDGMRPWEEPDAAAVQEAFSDAEIQRWHVLRLDDEDEARDWVAQWARRWADEEAASWAIVDESDQVLGQIGLRGIDLGEAAAGLSYWVLPSARGRGVAVRAVDVLARWCFDELGLVRVRLGHSTRNQQSCRVATKAGFPLEGTQRASMLHADGWHDAHLHALTRLADQ